MMSRPPASRPTPRGGLSIALILAGLGPGCADRGEAPTPVPPAAVPPPVSPGKGGPTKKGEYRKPARPTGRSERQ